MKKKIAFAVLNRNAPDLTNKFVERMVEHLEGHISLEDVFVLENGSSPEMHSKYANIIETNSYGVGWGMNKLINHCYDLGYDYIWLNHNDVYLEDPAGFLNWSMNLFERDKSVGTTLPWKDSWQWGLNCGELGRNNKDQNVSFWDHISTIFSRKTIELTKSFDSQFTPFDSSNFGGHYLMLCPALALYSNKMRVVTNSKYLVEEINLYTENNKEDLSSNVRGFGDQEWKKVVGPDSVRIWFDKLFPNEKNSSYNIKEKRNMLIRKVAEYAARSN